MSNSVNFCQTLSIFVKFCNFLSNSVNNYQFLSICDNFCKFLSIFVNLCQSLAIYLDIIFISYIYFTGQARPYLVFANQNDIRFVEVSYGNHKSPLRTTVVVRKLDDVQGLDFFLKKNKVCWTELNKPSIKCSEVNPAHKVAQEVIVSTGLERPEGLACDWINDNIYWTDSYTKRIEVVSISTGYRNVIISEDIDMPRSIAVAPNEGNFFDDFVDSDDEFVFLLFSLKCRGQFVYF